MARYGAQYIKRGSAVSVASPTADPQLRQNFAPALNALSKSTPNYGAKAQRATFWVLGVTHKYRRAGSGNFHAVRLD